MGRKFIGCEIDPEFFDRACRRIEAALSPTMFTPSANENLPEADQAGGAA
jgi:DNA modification methylase